MGLRVIQIGQDFTLFIEAKQHQILYFGKFYIISSLQKTDVVLAQIVQLDNMS
jgi:hypothetical protein